MNEANKTGEPLGLASTAELGQAPERAYVMAGTKDEGRGSAAFHAVHTTNNRYRISACGRVACGPLVPLSEAPEALRCRAPGCRAGFKLGA